MIGVVLQLAVFIQSRKRDSPGSRDQDVSQCQFIAWLSRCSMVFEVTNLLQVRNKKWRQETYV